MYMHGIFPFEILVRAQLLLEGGPFNPLWNKLTKNNHLLRQDNALAHLFYHVTYSKTCLKRPIKNRQNIGLNDKWKLNEGRKYCIMLKKSILQYF